MVVKTPTNEFPSTGEINRLRHEHEILSALDVDGVISVSRSKRVPANLIIGGETVAVGSDEPMFIA